MPLTEERCSRMEGRTDVTVPWMASFGRGSARVVASAHVGRRSILRAIQNAVSRNPAPRPRRPVQAARWRRSRRESGRTRWADFHDD